jgi:hypothetical protein
MPFELLQLALIQVLCCQKAVDILRADAFLDDFGIPGDLQCSSDEISRLMLLDIDDDSDLVSWLLGECADIANYLLRVISLNDQRNVDVPNEAVD